MRLYLKLSAFVIVFVFFFAVSQQAAAYQKLHRFLESPNTGNVRLGQQELASLSAECWNPWR